MQDYDIRGSPPRMRGKAEEIAGKIPGAGITPAYAGKSAPVWSRCPGAWDHPRVCGEKENRWGTRVFGVGSPPRMRGKAMANCSRCWPRRITPAYAGKSYGELLSMLAKEDHPRVCGEKVWRDRPPVDRAGSPPRMRGKGCSWTRVSCSSGITPAYAGKSCGSLAGGWPGGDHPRVCGEKQIIDPSGSLNQGSPPRMRGKDLKSIEIQAPFFLCAQISFNF